MDNEQYCTCKGNCLSKGGRNVCPCRAASIKCTLLCKCGNCVGCTNGKSYGYGEVEPRPKEPKIARVKLTTVNGGIAKKRTKNAVVAKTGRKLTKVDNDQITKLSHSQLVAVLKDIIENNPTVVFKMPEQESPKESSDNADVIPDGEKPEPSPSATPVQAAPDWCLCENCTEMPTPVERVCCATRRGVGCVTDGRFNELILDRERLYLQMQLLREVANFRYLDVTRCYRHAAYKAFTAWCNGPLGKHNRKVVPSCAVRKIRAQYPSANGLYTGFRAVVARGAGRGRGRGGRM